MSPFLRGRKFSPSSKMVPKEQSATPEKPRTEVYQRVRTHQETELKLQKARKPCDQFLELMKDGMFHSAYELQGFKGITGTLDRGDWVPAFRELIEYGFCFERLGNSFRMTRRVVTTAVQNFDLLLCNLDLRYPEDVQRLRERDVMEKKIQSTAAADPLLFDEPESELPEVGWSGNNTDEGEDERETVLEDLTLPPESDRLCISTRPGDCVLPARESVTATRAVVAKKSAGKTYLGMVMALEFLRHRFPFVVLDPLGVWYGICADVSGKPSGHELLILGGRHGVVPILPAHGEKIADLVMHFYPLPVLLDMSDLLPEEQHEFVAGFCARLYSICRKAIHLFIDEGDEFAPQSVDASYKHQRRCLNVIDRLVRRGRTRGIGSTIFTQRIAVANKNVLSQVSGMFVMNLFAPNDLRAVDDWMQSAVSSSSMRTECLNSLAGLSRGEAYFVQNGHGVSPLTRFVVKPKATYDSSRTPMVGEATPIEPHLSRPSLEILEEVFTFLGVVDGSVASSEIDENS